MALTPPSLSSSPAPPQQSFESPPSPPETSCPSEGSTNDYASPALLGRTVDISPPYGSIEAFSVSPALHQQETFLQPLNAMSHNAWLPPDEMVTTSPSASSSSMVPSVLSAEYDPFAAYESCLPTSFQGQDSYPPPPPSHSSLSQGLSTATMPSQIPSSSRPSLGHVHDPSNPSIKVENLAAYPPSLGAAHYPGASPIQAGPSSGASSFPMNIHPYYGDVPVPAWTKQEYDTPQYYGSPQGQSSDLGQERQSAKAARTRRQPRKHTTKEEANFQCEVKGCGKFFSRSYNYKSHLETHDEKREYPFPCLVEGCTKKFVRKTDLQRHHQSVHTKERNHKCDYCGRLFARKDTLRRHMEDGCSKRFDIGTLDLRGESYGGMGQGNRSGQADFEPMAQSSTILPPIAMNPVLPSSSSSSRTRGSNTPNFGSGHENTSHR